MERFLQVKLKETDEIYTYINCRHVLIFEIIKTASNNYTIEFTMTYTDTRFLYFEDYSEEGDAICEAANLFEIQGRD